MSELIVPTVKITSCLPYMQTKQDFMTPDGSFSGLNSDYAYTVRSGDHAIAMWCKHDDLYIHKTPHPDIPPVHLGAVMLAYDTWVPAKYKIFCHTKAFKVGCAVHNVDSVTGEELSEELKLVIENMIWEKRD